MGGQAADMAVKINRGTVLPDSEQARRNLEDKRGRVLRIEKRNRDADFSISTVDVKSQAI
jgi:hypothetical protein